METLSPTQIIAELCGILLIVVGLILFNKLEKEISGILCNILGVAILIGSILCYTPVCSWTHGWIDIELVKIIMSVLATLIVEVVLLVCWFMYMAYKDVMEDDDDDDDDDYDGDDDDDDDDC